MDLINTDKAWAAGIIDGEGCVSIVCNRSRKAFNLRVHVTNTDMKMLLKLQLMFGGRIYGNSAKNQPAHYKERWYWVVHCKNAHDVLITTLPYLVTKKEQAEKALTFQAVTRRHGGRPHTFREENAKRYLLQEEIFNSLQSMKKEGR